MTYQVILENGDKVGPATVEDLRKWLQEGRFGPETVVEDEEGVQRTLGELAVEEPGTRPAATEPPKETRPYAPVGGSPAWHATAGLGCVAVVFVAALTAILFPLFSQAKGRAKETTTLRRLGALATGTMMYSEDNDGHMPPVMSDSEAVKPFIASYVIDEKAYESLDSPGMPFLGNAKVAGISVASVARPSRTVLFLDQRRWTSKGWAVVHMDCRARFEPDFDPATGLKVK